MSHIELSPEEHSLLMELLEHSLAELENEIQRTDSLEFKDTLKRRRLVLKTLLAKTHQPIQDFV
jgi:hypothetical protein